MKRSPVGDAVSTVVVDTASAPTSQPRRRSSHRLRASINCFKFEGSYGIDAPAHAVGLPAIAAHRSSNSGAPAWNSAATASRALGGSARSRLVGCADETDPRTSHRYALQLARQTRPSAAQRAS